MDVKGCWRHVGPRAMLAAAGSADGGAVSASLEAIVQSLNLSLPRLRICVICHPATPLQPHAARVKTLQIKRVEQRGDSRFSGVVSLDRGETPDDLR